MTVLRGVVAILEGIEDPCERVLCALAVLREMAGDEPALLAIGRAANAARQARYRERHAGVTPVTLPVTLPVTGRGEGGLSLLSLSSASSQPESLQTQSERGVLRTPTTGVTKGVTRPVTSRVTHRYAETLAADPDDPDAFAAWYATWKLDPRDAVVVAMATYHCGKGTKWRDWSKAHKNWKARERPAGAGLVSKFTGLGYDGKPERPDAKPTNPNPVSYRPQPLPNVMELMRLKDGQTPLSDALLPTTKPVEAPAPPLRKRHPEMTQEQREAERQRQLEMVGKMNGSGP